MIWSVCMPHGGYDEENFITTEMALNKVIMEEGKSWRPRTFSLAVTSTLYLNARVGENSRVLTVFIGMVVMDSNVRRRADRGRSVQGMAVEQNQAEEIGDVLVKMKGKELWVMKGKKRMGRLETEVQETCLVSSRFSHGWAMDRKGRWNPCRKCWRCERRLRQQRGRQSTETSSRFMKRSETWRERRNAENLVLRKDLRENEEGLKII